MTFFEYKLEDLLKSKFQKKLELIEKQRKKVLELKELAQDEFYEKKYFKAVKRLLKYLKDPLRKTSFYQHLKDFKPIKYENVSALVEELFQKELSKLNLVTITGNKEDLSKMTLTSFDIYLGEELDVEKDDSKELPSNKIKNLRNFMEKYFEKSSTKIYVPPEYKGMVMEEPLTVFAVNDSLLIQPQDIVSFVLRKYESLMYCENKRSLFKEELDQKYDSLSSLLCDVEEALNNIEVSQNTLALAMEDLEGYRKTFGEDKIRKDLEYLSSIMNNYSELREDLEEVKEKLAKKLDLASRLRPELEKAKSYHSAKKEFYKFSSSLDFVDNTQKLIENIPKRYEA